jgi:hypothetical protein
MEIPRKATAKTRDERLEARISRDQKALFQRAAELQGRTLTDFVIAGVHEAAVRVIEERRRSGSATPTAGRSPRRSSIRESPTPGSRHPRNDTSS